MMCSILLLSVHFLYYEYFPYYSIAICFDKCTAYNDIQLGNGSEYVYSSVASAFSRKIIGNRVSSPADLLGVASRFHSSSHNPIEDEHSRKQYHWNGYHAQPYKNVLAGDDGQSVKNKVDAVATQIYEKSTSNPLVPARLLMWTQKTGDDCQDDGDPPNCDAQPPRQKAASVFAEKDQEKACKSPDHTGNVEKHPFSVSRPW
jgi:hypothetical protein